jgi:hypothetical protein
MAPDGFGVRSLNGHQVRKFWRKPNSRLADHHTKRGAQGPRINAFPPIIGRFRFLELRISIPDF